MLMLGIGRGIARNWEDLVLVVASLFAGLWLCQPYLRVADRPISHVHRTSGALSLSVLSSLTLNLPVSQLEPSELADGKHSESSSK